MRFLFLAMRQLTMALAGFSAIATSSAATELKVGYLPVTGHAKFFVAQEQGFFAQEGLQVELVEFQNSADGLNAIVAGKLDIGAFGTSAPLVHFARGEDLKIIGGIMGEDAAIVARPELAASIHSISDLKGRRIATVRLATGDGVLRGALNDSHLSWKTDLQLFELKNPSAVLEAVKSGQVDAGVVWGPHDIRAEQQGLKVVIRSSDLQPGHPCCRLVATSARIAQNPDAWRKFLRAILRAEHFAADHRTETLDAIQKYVKLDRDTLEKGYYQPHLDQTTDPNVRGVRRFWGTLVASEFIDGKRPLDPAFDVGLYRAALQSLAKEEPKDPSWQERLKTFDDRDRL